MIPRIKPGAFKNDGSYSAGRINDETKVRAVLATTVPAPPLLVWRALCAGQPVLVVFGFLDLRTVRSQERRAEYPASADGALSHHDVDPRRGIGHMAIDGARKPVLEDVLQMLPPVFGEVVALRHARADDHAALERGSHPGSP